MKKIERNPLKKRIIELSYKHSLGHIGSCLTCVDILDGIYAKRKPNDPVILSNGHAGLALYVVLEKYLPESSAEYLLRKHGVHPNRDMLEGIWCSTGSLGQGLPIAVGMALADRSRDVWCVISDGESAEGSIWEAIHVAQDQRLTNLHLFVNMNGWAAYRPTNLQRIRSIQGQYAYPYIDFIETNCDEFPFLQGLQGHYHPLTEEEYHQALEILK